MKYYHQIYPDSFWNDILSVQGPFTPRERIDPCRLIISGNVLKTRIAFPFTTSQELNQPLRAKSKYQHKKSTRRHKTGKKRWDIGKLVAKLKIKLREHARGIAGYQFLACCKLFRSEVPPSRRKGDRISAEDFRRVVEYRFGMKLDPDEVLALFHYLVPGTGESVEIAAMVRKVFSVMPVLVHTRASFARDYELKCLNKLLPAFACLCGPVVSAFSSKKNALRISAAFYGVPYLRRASK